MRIWTTCIGQRLDNAENTRTMILCDHLLRRGHDVTLWTSAYDHIRKQWRQEWREHGASYRMPTGLTVRFMKGCGYQRNISVRRLVDHLLAGRDFERQARQLAAPQAIIASLPDHITAAAAVRYGKSVGAATLVDVRDKWPDIFIDHAPSASAKAMIRLGLSAESRRAARALRSADSLVAMMQSMMDWAVRKACRSQEDRDKVFYLTTTPKNFDVAKPDPSSLPPQVAAALDAVRDKTVFAFIGTFNRTQHPALLLDALDLLRSRGQLDRANIAFLVGGDGVGAEAVWRRVAGFDNVHELGWLDARAMGAVLASSHVGLLLMNFPSPAFNNKAFAYLASGLPIINGATGDLEALIESEGTGINVRGGDVQALADAIRTLADDADLLSAMTARTRALFDTRFNRQSNYAAYADHIEAVASSMR